MQRINIKFRLMEEIENYSQTKHKQTQQISTFMRLSMYVCWWLNQDVSTKFSFKTKVGS